MSNEVISFRINEVVIKHVHELGINNVANKVERFLIMLLEASLDGQKYSLDRDRKDTKELFKTVENDLRKTNDDPSDD